MRRWLCLPLLAAALLPMAEARTPVNRHRRSSSLTLRRRLFTSPLIASPGNLDLELSSAFDTNSSYYLPSTLKYTPFGLRTEFSGGFDTVASQIEDSGDRDTHFSDHLSLAATTAFHAGEHFDWAFAPTASLFLRGESGVRLGGTLLGRYERARSTLSTAVSWSGATSPSASNPAGILDINFGYARQLSPRWTGYSNLQGERASGAGTQYSLFEGLEFQINDRFAIDFSGQHYALNSIAPDHQLVLGLTYTLFRHK